MSVVVILPVYNAEAWCRTFVPEPGTPYVALDNASTDATAALLRERGVTVITHDRNIGRVENWAFAVRWFAQSDYLWMKWLFAGDRLLPGIAAKVVSVAELFPEARLIAGGYVVVEEGTRHTFEREAPTRIVRPPEALRAAARRGNWFGAPVALALHREAASASLSFGMLDYVADFHHCVEVASRFPVVNLVDKVGEFHACGRSFYSRYGRGIGAFMETVSVRKDAADRYYLLTGDERGRSELLKEIYSDLAAERLRRDLASMPPADRIAAVTSGVGRATRLRAAVNEVVRRRVHADAPAASMFDY